MIQEVLNTGRENAITGQELADFYKCDIREITERIARERREGAPICAATRGKPGYYLPETREELEAYCERLKGRAIELFKTRQALIHVLKQIPETNQNTTAGNTGKQNRVNRRKQRNSK